MKTKIFSILLLLSLWSCTSSEPLMDFETRSEALNNELNEPAPDSITVNSFELNRVVKQFVAGANIKAPLSRNNPYEVILNDEGNPQAYVVNFGNNQGYVVISATKDYNPIIACSDEGNFDVYRMPEPVKSWFQDLDNAIQSNEDDQLREKYHSMWRQYERAHISPIVESRDLRISVEDWQIIRTQISDSMNSWRNNNCDVYTLDELELINPELFEKYDEMARANIWCEYEDDYRLVSYVVFKHISSTSFKILMDTKWDQYSLFNESFPEFYDEYGFGRKAPAGCGPVALGQICYYHQYPRDKKWNEMDPIKATKASQDFLYEIAVKANATITIDETETDKVRIKKVLDLYKYAYNVTDKSEDYEKKAMESLKNGRPVYVGNSMYSKTKGKYVGHAWVLDGSGSVSTGEIIEFCICRDKRKFEMYDWTPVYSDSGTLYHINWGYGGQYSGNYSSWQNYTPKDYSDGEITYIIDNIRPL